MKQVMLLLLTLGVVCSAFGNAAQAITIRADTDDSLYTALAASSYPQGGIVWDTSAGYYGSGTLISPSWILTAGHCISANDSYRFLTSSTGQISVDQTIVYPGLDIGLAHLSTPITSVNPVKLYSLAYGVEDGQEAVIVGAGNTGNGLTGQQGGTGWGYRAAQTFVLCNADAWGWGSSSVLTKFRDPRDPNSGAAPLEGGGAQGDSGGALILNVDGQSAIAGVMSQVWWNEGITTIGQYNTGGAYVRSAPLNDWILSYATDATIVTANNGPGEVVLQWDADGTSPVNGGAGTWDTTNARWYDTSHHVWNNSSIHDAVFGAAGGAISLGANITAQNLTFNVNGYSIANQTLTLAGNTPTITVANASDTATISSAIAGTSGMTKAGAGKLTLSNINSYSGATVVNGGTLELNGPRLLGPGVIGSSSSITVNASGTLRLTGFDGLSPDVAPGKTLTINEGGTLVAAQSDHLSISYVLNVAGGTISSEGSAGYWGNFGNIFFGSSNTLNFTSGSGGTASKLSAASTSLGGNVVFNVTRGSGRVDLLVSGNLQNGYLPSGELYMTGGLTKSGNGVMVLTGANTYTGVTTVTAGTLQMSESSYTNVATNGGADIQGGKGVLDYSASGVSPALDIQTLLAASYNGGVWDIGQIHNTTAATTGLSLGWNDDTTAQQLTIMATYAGDANLSGKVDVADLTLLLNNYNKTSRTWKDGDFNYDGFVNVADLTALLNRYNKAIGGSFAAGAGLSMGSSAVPEPSCIVMLAGGALTALLYWRRKRA